MGFISTGDSYTYRGDVALAGLEVNKVVDNMAFGADTYKELMKKQLQVMERCAKYGITINAQKSKLAGAKQIPFVGYKISENDIKIDDRKMSAVRDYPIPEDRSQLRSFMALATHLGEVTPEFSKTAEPLRHLLSTKNTYQWLADHTSTFKEVKKILTSDRCRGMYDPKAETELEVDASRKGLGFILRQKQEDDEWKWIHAGSRFLQDAETRYAMVELEALAIFYAVKKNHLYLAGLPHFTVNSDHRPLESIFNEQMTSMVQNPRVQNYRTKLVGYDFTVKYVKGIENTAPDALSRSPVDQPTEEDEEDAKMNHFNMATCRTTDMIIEDLKEKAKLDTEYQSLIQAIMSGRLEKKKRCPGYLNKFRSFSHLLSIEDDLVYKDNVVVIPNNAIVETLKKLHLPHQGMEKTKRRARQSVFWPGINQDIENYTRNCEYCAELRPTQQLEPLCSMDNPTRPFEMATADLFSYNKQEYLVYADRYSGFPIVFHYARAPNASQVISAFRRIFAMMGAPTVLRSDNGPQFAADRTQKFLKTWGVTWKPSAPLHPQSNGHAESMVKNVKYLIMKNEGKYESDECQKGMLELRNSPKSDGVSPAERLFGRPLRSDVPMHWKKYDDRWQKLFETADQNLSKINAKRKKYFDRRAKDLTKLNVGQEVIVQDQASGRWTTKATIVDVKHPRRYQLRFPSGRVLWRNRQVITKAPQCTRA